MVMAQYRSIAAALRSRIEAGTYPIGSKLPSIAALMTEFNVKGLNTVRAAQQVLVDEGLLRPEQGVGVWVVSQGSRQPNREGLEDDLRQAKAAIVRALARLEETDHA